MEDYITYFAVGGAVGISSHLLYFIRGEHHKYAHRWFIRALIGIAILGVGILRLTKYQLLLTLALTVLTSISFFVGLYGSIGLYRVLFHPLRKFNGPFLARLSNFYHMYIIRKSDNYLKIKKMHEKYGPIVRTGKQH